MGLSPSRSVCDGLHQHRPCVWSSVPCWSTGDAGYPHSQLRAWKQNRPVTMKMHRADSQSMRGLGVPPELVVEGVGNEWESTVTLFLVLLRNERQCFRTSEAFGP